MSEPEVIFEEWSPVCNINAFVEESDTCYYFYLWVNPESDSAVVKSCWIGNIGVSPEELDVEGMGEGIAPQMPKQYVLHGEDGLKLDADKFGIVWFEEGNAAALLYDNEIISVIPGWSGYNGFNGYAKYAKGVTPLAWGLSDAYESLSKRVKESKAFWARFEEDFWTEVQSGYLAALEAFFGVYEKYYAIDGGEFPPKALVRGSKDGVVYGITAGVSLIPMPNVEMVYGDGFREYRRMELGFAVTAENEGLCNSAFSFMSGLSAFPWREDTFLAHGHTVPINFIKGFEAVLFIDPKKLSGVETPDYKKCMGEKINLLWIVPITGEEYRFITEHDVDENLSYARDIERIHIFDGENKFTGMP